MKLNSSATLPDRPVLSGSRAGLGWGLLGVAGFSFTVPFTRVAVQSGAISPLFVASGRAVVAAVLAAGALALTGQRPPRGGQWARLAVVAAGVVAGFPLLTSFALTAAPAGHSAVVIALLPAATAVMAVLRGGERPPPAFWAMAAAGAAVTAGFAWWQGGGGSGGLRWADLLLLGAVAAAAVGYAEGGLLSRELGAWQTISWALVLAAPVMLVLAGLAAAARPPAGTPAEWAAFGYLGLVSMFLGFFAWYRGLAIGPIAQVGQIQLVQPVLGVSWAALLLGERITWATVLGGLAVIGCAGLAIRTRQKPSIPDKSDKSTIAE
ncbi:membrane protein [Sphaerisporangium rufum]|uniref:Membrane protein n=1 Tax=Sphaerisporangium rufum TaxID=1381558 RepID=A0A919R695_9ACTN|nr:DMT family transporter [Sphaerisporangium rufum]GII79060.1 membrane protein [Sphaerisporangium rufum]